MLLKKDLRKHIRGILSTLTMTEVNDQSHHLVFQAMEALRSLNVSPKSGVSIFLSKDNSTHEVNTQELITELRQAGYKLFVPYICPTAHDHRTMTMLELKKEEDISAFAKDRWGIPVLPNPESRLRAHPVDLHVIFFPGLGFDLKTGNRLGQGMGFYDTFVKEFDQQRREAGLGPVVKIGLALKEMLVSFVPMEPHDVGMDVILVDQQQVW